MKLRDLLAEEQESLRNAKTIEIQSWVKNRAAEAALHEGYLAKDLTRMRWVITSKADGALKARLVVLGYTDPQLGHIKTASPTGSRRGRQVFMSMAASFGMMVAKRDVNTAFPQGDTGEEQRDIVCEPVKELREHLGLQPDGCVRLLKSVYGF